MPVSSGFFNSLHGDRRYDAVQLSSIFDGVLNDGVYQGYGSKFVVEATTGRIINIGTGRAWFDHTWILNDSVLELTLDVAHGTLDRYDDIVIEVNTSDAVRANTIKFVKGVGAATAVRPTLTNTATIKQYPIGTVFRPANSTTVVPLNITNLVGTQTPYVSHVVSGNLDVFSLFDAIGNSKMHRNVFRGKNLGGSFTAEQRAAIQNGSFNDLWLGDYWVINGVNWRIADFNYWHNTGDAARFTFNHLVILPDTVLYTAKMNTAETVGYATSEMRNTNLNSAKTTINNAFPTAVRTHREVLTTNWNGGNPASAWYDSTVDIPTEQMFFGTSFHGKDKVTTSGKQLALLSVDPTFAFNPTNNSTWFRNIATESSYVGWHNPGKVDYFVCWDTIGVRPVFAIS